jgi:hypothetical protein
MKHSHSNSIGPNPEKLPVLVVAFCRSRNLYEILNSLIGEDRRVYVVIDKATDRFVKENKEVISCAKSFEDKLNLRIRVNEENAGVKMGVPNAVEYVLTEEFSCIVLEDDCLADNLALNFFDSMATNLKENICLVTGDSPWFKDEVDVNTVSTYPLIWGWATNRPQWNKLKIFVNQPAPWKVAFKTLCRKPNLAIPIAFFLASQIRIEKEKLQAWDCSLALSMILQDLKCIIPSTRLTSNIGNDEFAHHTLSQKSVRTETVSMGRRITERVSYEEKLEHITDAAIQKRIYKMKWFHLMSPLKALIS